MDGLTRGQGKVYNLQHTTATGRQSAWLTGLIVIGEDMGIFQIRIEIEIWAEGRTGRFLLGRLTQA